MMQKLLLLAFLVCAQSSNLLAQTPDWEHIPGPDAGTISNFDQDGAFLYGLTKAGVYRSSDEGYHWELVPASLLTTRDKRQLHVENGIFYAMNDEGALLRSENQGAIWNPILQKPFPQDYESESLQTVFVKGDTLLVGSYFTIYRSTNRGETWTSTEDLVPASFVSIFEYKNEFFAAQDRYIYRSSDGGLTWKTVFTNFIGYAAVLATDSFLYAFYNNRTRMIRSNNGLRSWDVVDTDTILNFLEEDPFGSYPSKWVGGSGKMLYFFQSGNSEYLCNVRFCYSNDNGITWHRGNKGAQLPIGNRFSGGINLGAHLLLSAKQFYHSIDSAKTFFTAYSGLNCARITQLFNEEQHLISTTNLGRGYLTRDFGQSWSRYPMFGDSVNICYPTTWFWQTGRRLFQFKDNRIGSETFVSEDGGQTWHLLVSKNAYDLLATDNAFWFRTSEWVSGIGAVRKFWQLADQDSIIREVQFPTINFGNNPYLDIWDLDEKIGFESENEILIFDENTNPVQKIPLLPCLALSPGELTHLFVANNTFYNFCNDRCFIFPPNATEWQEIYPQDWTTGIPFYHSPMTFFQEHDGVIWVGLEGKGLFYATDNTGRFYPVEPQMPYPYPTSISFDENKVWVGTDGGGIWTYPLAKPLDGQSEKGVFKAFPNPSSGELNLQSELFIKDEIDLSVLDASGRRVAKKRLPPGQYWSLDFPGLPKGLYFLQMRTDIKVFGLKWVLEK